MTKLLAGETSCEWAAWFQAQHESSSWEKVPNTFDNVAWKLAHTAQLNKVRERFEKRGYAVQTENQNSFTLKGSSGTLGGTPDLIARKGSAAVIIDVKTGKPRQSDSVQVMIYMWAVPRAEPQYKGVTIAGLVVYSDHEVDIPASAIDGKFADSLIALIRRVGATEQARKVPSAAECGFCKITRLDCPERAAEARSMATTDEF